MPTFRRFELHRSADVTGVSGTGIVADGVEYYEPFTVTFPDGGVRQLLPSWVRITWRGPYSSTVLWDSITHVLRVHGHDGATTVVWLPVEKEE